MDATDILPLDINKALQDVSALKQSFSLACSKRKELEDAMEILKSEVARSRANEDKEKCSIDTLTQDFVKLQTSVANISEIKRENIILKDKVKEFEIKVAQINANLEKERLSCHELMKKHKKELEEQADSRLANAHSEVESLRRRLSNSEDQLRKKTLEFQKQIRNAEHDKSEEMQQRTYEFQEKINKLQSALTITQAENRNIRDRLQFNTITYQKKIQELERRHMHPALRGTTTTAAVTANRGKQNLPQLRFLATNTISSENTEIGIDNMEDQSRDFEQLEPTTTKSIKRRKLFLQKNIPE